MKVLVRFNNVDMALRSLKRNMQREGRFKSMKHNRYYEKPSDKRHRKEEEAFRRRRKGNRSRYGNTIIDNRVAELLSSSSTINLDLDQKVASFLSS